MFVQSLNSSQDSGARTYRRHTVCLSVAFIIVQTKVCWIIEADDRYFWFLHQGGVEFWCNQICAEFGGNFDMPVVYYCQFVSVSRAGIAGNTALQRRFNKIKNLEEIAAK